MKSIPLALAALVAAFFMSATVEAAGTGNCGQRYIAPAVSTYSAASGDDGTLISAANATGAAVGSAGASIAISLPSTSSIASGWTLCAVSDTNKAPVFQAPLLAAPTPPTLGSASGGSIAAITYYVKITYTNLSGETVASTEASLAVGANRLLTVATPGASGNATGWNVYVATATGIEELQNASPLSLSANWTEPLGGLITGGVPPSAGSAPSAYILAAGQSLSSMVVGPLDSVVTQLQSDGTNFRVISSAPQALAINGMVNGMPDLWEFPGGAGYAATQGDNTHVISSGLTSSGLAVTLPRTPTLASGWTVGLDNLGQPLTVQLNGTNGGTLVTASGSAISTPYTINGVAWVQFDGARFRLLQIGAGQQVAVSNTQLANFSAGQAVWRLGFYVPGDTDPVLYAWNASCPGTPDNGKYVAASAGGSGCWVAAFSQGGALLTEWGARCNGSTDDSTPINAALASAADVPIIGPASRICAHGSTIAVPGAATFEWADFSASYPQQSGLLCSVASSDPCVSIGTNTNQAPDVHNVAEFYSGTAPTGVIGFQFNGGYALRPHDLFAYGETIGFNLAHASTAGIAFFGDRLFTCNISDAHFQVTGNWPEIHVSDSRFGCNGAADVTGNAYVRFLDSGGTGAGPTTFTQDQFNLGSGALVNQAFEFVNSTNMNLVTFDDGHIETAETFISTDSSTTLVQGLSFINSTYVGNWVSTDHFFDKLNAATQIEDWHFAGDVFYGAHWDLSQPTSVNGLTVTWNTFYPEITITAAGTSGAICAAPTPVCTQVILDHNRYAAIGVALTLQGTGFTSSMVGGVIQPSASTVANVSTCGTNLACPIEIDIPGGGFISACSSSMALQFGGSSAGITYATPPICYWELHASTAIVTFYFQLSSAGSASGSATATITGLPFATAGSVGPGQAPVYAVNMSGLTGPITADVGASSSYLNLYEPGTGGTGVTVLQKTNFTSTSVLEGTFAYMIP